MRSAVPSVELEALRRLYRGECITVARLLADLHSGASSVAAVRIVYFS